ncbi:hypothetical protein [Bradyrhizobium sp. 142]|uniref:hypothetical protein n=1 Tax=Bradyrhizobium sp. 142 TaxID=2782618 RepID=UPI001FF8319A|nr:hypothetical protein [Bradyrhizobium sp. 142]MCK1727304.1 hypothetical protein [Bradyrhizobium sp. 142]
MQRLHTSARTGIDLRGNQRNRRSRGIPRGRDRGRVCDDGSALDGTGSKLLGPEQQTLITWKVFLPETPEYRDLEAFDFVYTEFGELARNLGQAKAQMERDTLVSRAVSRGISETGIEAAITILIFAEYMAEKDGVLRFAMPVNGNGPLPSEQMKAQRVAMPRDTRSQLMPIVKDVISRRADGWPRHAEPFDAFAARLNSLDYAGFIRGGCRSFRS